MIKFRIQIQDLEQIVPIDFVQVAVGQRPYVTARFPDGRVFTRVFAEYIVFTCDKSEFDLNEPRHDAETSPHSLKMAMTTLSLSISMEPRDMKYKDVSTSPWCTRVSPGGACVVRNFNDSALKCSIQEYVIFTS